MTAGELVHIYGGPAPDGSDSTHCGLVGRSRLMKQHDPAAEFIATSWHEIKRGRITCTECIRTWTERDGRFYR